MGIRSRDIPFSCGHDMLGPESQFLGSMIPTHIVYLVACRSATIRQHRCSTSKPFSKSLSPRRTPSFCLRLAATSPKAPLASIPAFAAVA